MEPLFCVIATQNPVEFRGTYPLPEAQMDRFALCLSLGYVDAGTEVEVLTAQEHITSALRITQGRIEGRRGAAALLKINPHTLRARMRKLEVDWSSFRS